MLGVASAVWTGKGAAGWDAIMTTVVTTATTATAMGDNRRCRRADADDDDDHAEYRAMITVMATAPRITQYRAPLGGS